MVKYRAIDEFTLSLIFLMEVKMKYFKKAIIVVLVLSSLITLSGCTSQDIKKFNEKNLDYLMSNNIILDEVFLDAYFEKYSEEELFEELFYKIPYFNGRTNSFYIDREDEEIANYLLPFIDLVSQKTSMHFSRLGEMKESQGYYTDHPVKRTKTVSKNVADNPGYSLKTHIEEKTNEYTIEKYGDFCVERGKEWKYLDVYDWIGGKFYDISKWVKYDSISLLYKGKEIFREDNAPNEDSPWSYDVEPMESDEVEILEHAGEYIYVCDTIYRASLTDADYLFLYIDTSTAPEKTDGPAIYKIKLD